MVAEKKSICAFHGAAGGWAALTASMRALIQEKALQDAIHVLRANQPDGFDCPGCAWPEAAGASRFDFCENGVKAMASEMTHKQIGPDFFAKHSVSYLREQSSEWLESQGRLIEPLSYHADDDHYYPIDWEQAFVLIADEVRQLDRPDQTIFYTSGRTSNEAAYFYQLLGRLWGTPHFPDSSNLCHESSGVALTETIGVGKGTVTLDDFAQADMIVVIGQNPGTNHPRMLATLQECHRRGAKIVSFNPLIEPGLKRFLHPQEAWAMLSQRAQDISTHYYQPLIGGDLAVLKGLIKGVLTAEQRNPGQILDHSFLTEHTIGLSELFADIARTSWSEIELESGLTQTQLTEVVDLYLRAKSVIVCWAMGLTQHRYAVATIQYITNWLLLRGHIGKPGSGVCPVRGHSNVQGDRTMGITIDPKESFLEHLEQRYHFTAPRKKGFTAVEAIKALYDGRAQVLIGLGGNLVAAAPDTAYTEQAVARSRLTVMISTKLNRSHVVHGRKALILPCLGRSEMDRQASGPQKVTIEDSMSMVHASQGGRAPASPWLRSEVAIIAGIAQAMLPQRLPWQTWMDDYGVIRKEIAEVIPGFIDFNEKILQPGGFYLGNSARERRWQTPCGKARFLVHPLPVLRLPEPQLRLMTIRSHDQFNTTVYGLNDRYRGIAGTRQVIFMSVSDMEQRGLAAHDLVRITSHAQDHVLRQLIGFEVIAYDLPSGCAAVYFPEANGLVSVHSVAEKSDTPVFKLIPVTVEKLEHF
jgi:molybdopterin-dependent oxidoreductase alpha subunit